MWCVYCMLLNAVNERVIKLYVKEFFNSRSCRELAFECLFYSVALYIFNFLCAWGVCVLMHEYGYRHVRGHAQVQRSLPSAFETGYLVHHFPCQPSWPTSFQGVSCAHLPSHYRTVFADRVTEPTFLWVAGIRTQVPTLVQPSLYPQFHLPSS